MHLNYFHLHNYVDIFNFDWFFVLGISSHI